MVYERGAVKVGGLVFYRFLGHNCVKGEIQLKAMPVLMF